MQNQTQRCLFPIFLHPESQKCMKFQWRGQLFQFLCLCSGLGNDKTDKVDGAANNLFRRYFNYGGFNRGIDSGSRQSDLCSTRFGFLDKHKNISFGALSNFRASRYGNKFKRNDFDTSRGEKEQNRGTASISIEDTKSDYQRVASGYT